MEGVSATWGPSEASASGVMSSTLVPFPPEKGTTCGEGAGLSSAFTPSLSKDQRIAVEEDQPGLDQSLPALWSHCFNYRRREMHPALAPAFGKRTLSSGKKTLYLATLCMVTSDCGHTPPQTATLASHPLSLPRPRGLYSATCVLSCYSFYGSLGIDSVLARPCAK